MWLQFFSQDAHFTISLFAALVCLAVGWLHFDAWSNKRNWVGLLRFVGFISLSMSFLAQSTVVEQSVLGSLPLAHDAVGVTIVFRLIAFACIILSQILDPLQEIPKTIGLESSLDVSASKNVTLPPSATLGVYGVTALVTKWFVPFGGLVTAGLYWRRATTGLERHLKLVAIAFLLIGSADLIHQAALLRMTQNPLLSSWVAAFGPIWWIEQIVLLAGLLVLSRWVWSYLTERFFSQLFMILVSTTVAIFLVVSVVFTALLLQSTRTDMVDNLHTAAQVVSYAIVAKQTETTAGAELLADNLEIVAAVQTKDHKSLSSLTAGYLAAKKQSSLIITDPNGQVLLRGEEPSRWGSSVSGDALIRRALLGSESTGIDVSEGIIAPAVTVRSSVPIVDSQHEIVGSVTTSVNLDQAFVDGLKSKTGLQSSVYGGNVVSATTLLASDNTTHLTGTTLSNVGIKNQVLTRGDVFSGNLTIANRSFIGAMVPLKDVDNVPVGMLLVAQPQTTILRSAGRSVELTFALTASLLLVSVAPAYFITKSLVKQLGKA